MCGRLPPFDDAPCDSIIETRYPLRQHGQAKKSWTRRIFLARWPRRHRSQVSRRDSFVSRLASTIGAAGDFSADTRTSTGCVTRFTFRPAAGSSRPSRVPRRPSDQAASRTRPASAQTAPLVRVRGCRKSLEALRLVEVGVGPSKLLLHVCAVELAIFHPWRFRSVWRPAVNHARWGIFELMMSFIPLLLYR